MQDVKRRVIGTIGLALALAVAVGSQGWATAREAGHRSASAGIHRHDLPFFKHHPFPRLRKITSFAVDARRGFHALALTPDLHLRFIAHRPGKPYVVSKLVGPRSDPAHPTGFFTGASLTPTANRQAAYLITVGCHGIYGAKVPSKARRPPTMTRANRIMPFHKCGPTGSLPFNLESEAFARSGEIMISGEIDDGKQYGPMVITGTPGQPLTATYLGGRNFYDVSVAPDRRTGNVYAAGLYADDEGETGGVAMMTYHAAAGRWSEPRSVQKFRSDPRASVRSVAADAGRLAIEISTMAKGTTTHLELDQRLADRSWTGFKGIPHADCAGEACLSSTRISYAPSTGALVTLNVMSGQGTSQILVVHRLARDGDWSPPTTLVKLKPRGPHYDPQIADPLMQLLHAGRLDYSYRATQWPIRGDA